MRPLCTQSAMAEAMLDPEYRTSSLPDLAPLDPPVSGDFIDPAIPELKQPTSSSVKKSGNKTVVINVPPKRQRSSPLTTAKQIVEGINLSVSLGDRTAAVEAACYSFNHGMESVHDEELAAFADVALTKHLAYLVCLENCHQRKGDKQTITSVGNAEVGPFDSDNINDQDSGEILQEISRTCEALEMVYRASATAVASSFSNVGIDLLTLLLYIVDKEVSYNNDKETCTCNENRIEEQKQGIDLPEKCGSASNMETERSLSKPKSKNGIRKSARSLSLRKSMKIMGHFARAGSATQPMAYHAGLLSSLKRIIDHRTGFIPSEVRLSSLWIIANLACNPENMVMMACHPGLLDSLVEIATHPTCESDELSENLAVIRGNSIAARALNNLSWAPENKIPMSEHSNLLEALSQMLRTRVSDLQGRGHGVSGMLLQSRRHAAGAIRNLAAGPRRNKVCLCRHRNSSLLDALKDAARHEPDRGVQDRVFAAIFNLACVDTAEMLVNNPGLIQTLVDSAGPVEVESADQKTIASKTLRALEKSVTPDMKSYGTLHEIIGSAVNMSDGRDLEVAGLINEQPESVVSDSSAT